MNKRLIGVMSTLVITGSLFVGCSTGYQYDQNHFQAGKDDFENSLLAGTTMQEDYVEGFFYILENLAPGKEDTFYYADEKDGQKKNDDKMYGALTLVTEKLDVFPTMSVEEMIKDFNTDEASTSDMEDFRDKVAPYYVVLSNEIKKALSNPEFDGTIPKESYDKIRDIGEDLQIYYDRYFDKVIEYKH